jgi:hypothetical protein
MSQFLPYGQTELPTARKATATRTAPRAVGRLLSLLVLVGASASAGCSSDAAPSAHGDQEPADDGSADEVPGKRDAAARDVEQNGARGDAQSPVKASDAGVSAQGSPDGAAADTSNEPRDAATGVADEPVVSFPTADVGKDGPYASTTLTRTGPEGKYTVYLPAELSPNGVKHPIVGWMSGGSTTHTAYPLLPRLATHGFVVVAADVTPGIGDEVNLGKQIIAGIDWAIAENGRTDSKLFGKLDTTKLASMGYSMGSLSTFTIANDPRLTTTVHISGGNMAPERVNNLHAPAAFICGNAAANCNILSTSCDIAGMNCDTDFANAKTPVFYANFDGGHLGILTPPLQDQIGSLATAWLRWKLMSDHTLDVMFEGDQCSVCTDTKWKVQRKNLP